MAQHREALDAESQRGRELGQRLRGPLAAGQAVDHEPDLVAAGDLLAGEINDVSPQSAERRAQHMQDPQSAVGVVGTGAHGACLLPTLKKSVP